MKSIYSSAAFLDAAGVVQVGASAQITVRRESDLAIATLYADKDGTVALANPFAADTEGRFFFFADGVDQGYSVAAVAGGQTTTVRYQPLGNLQYLDTGGPITFGDVTANRFLAGNGTTSAPAYSFSGSQSLGITRNTSVNGADALIFYTASGVPAVSIARLVDGANTGVMFRGDGPVVWAPDGNLGAASITPSLAIWRDAAQTLAQRNGVNTQAFRVYNTFTDASNYERGELSHDANGLILSHRAAGTGTAKRVQIETGGTIRWIWNSAGGFLALADNSYDIGASGANRPRNVFIGGNYRADSGSSQVVNLVLTGSAGNLQAGVNAGKAVVFSSSGNLQLQVTSVGVASGSNVEFGGHVLPFADNTYDVGSAAARVRNVFTPFVDSGSAGDLSFKANSVVGFSVGAVAASVNFIKAVAQIAGATPALVALGTDTNISFTLSTKGNGSLSFQTNNFSQEQFRVAHTASAVNLLQVTGNIATGSPFLQAVGSDTNIGILYDAKGTGGHSFRTNAGGTQQFEVTNTASSTRWVQVTGSNGGNPTITTTAGSLAITPAVVMASDCQVTGTLDAPLTQNSKSANYTTVRADAGKHILHPTADNNARTFTIDSNANVAYPVGTCITFQNEINTVTISITTDTLTLMGSGATGNRTLAANGIATALKTAATKWVISGTGLT